MTLHPHDFQNVSPVSSTSIMDWTGIRYHAVDDPIQTTGKWAGKIHASGRVVTPEGSKAPPRPSEDHYEWLALLTAHDLAKDRFAMIEFGAGYGRWGMNAIALNRMRSRMGKPKPCQVMFVEPSPGRMAMLRAHLHANHVSESDHILTRKGLSWRGGERLNETGFGGWLDDRGQIEVETQPLPLFLDDFPGIIDTIHMDVQGMEFDVLTVEALAWLRNRVRMMHVATHGHAPGRSGQDEIDLRQRFGAAGWVVMQWAPADTVQQTVWGDWRTCDGFGTYLNRSLA